MAIDQRGRAPQAQPLIIADLLVGFSSRSELSISHYGSRGGDDYVSAEVSARAPHALRSNSYSGEADRFVVDEGHSNYSFILLRGSVIGHEKIIDSLRSHGDRVSKRIKKRERVNLLPVDRKRIVD